MHPQRQTGCHHQMCDAGNLLIGKDLLAGSTGLEPAASGVTGRRSNQLNYDPERGDLRIGRWRAAWLSHRRRAGERRLVGGTGLEPVTAGV